MSDPFAPSPLPPRPVYQTADIVEHGAAAEDRNLQLRYQEFAETGRLQMQRDMAQSQAQYRADVKTADMDYQQAINNPLAQIVSSIPEIALGIYQSIKEKDREQAYRLESGRQTSMLYAAKSDLNQGIRELMSRIQTEGLDYAEGRELLSEMVVQSTTGLNLSEDFPDLNENTLGQFQNFAFQTMERVYNQMYAGQKVRDAEATATDQQKASAGFISRFIDSNDEDAPGVLQEFEAWAIETDLQKEWGYAGADGAPPQSGGWLHSNVNDAYVDKLGAIGQQKYIDIMAAGVDGEGNTITTLVAAQMALAHMREHPLYAELGRRESAQTYRNRAENELLRLTGQEAGAQAQLDEALRGEFFVKLLDGEYKDLGPKEYQTMALNMGFTQLQAYNFGKQRAQEIEDEIQLTNSGIRQSYELGKEDERARTEEAILVELRTTSQIPPAATFAKTIQSLQANDVLKGGRQETKFWMDAHQNAIKGMTGRYQGEFAFIDSVAEAVGSYGTEKNGEVFLTTNDGKTQVPLAMLKAGWERQLNDMIANGVEEQDDNGDIRRVRYTSMNPVDPAHEGGGMMNIMQGIIKKDLGGYKTRGWIGSTVHGEEDIPPALQATLGGEQAVWSGESAAVRPLETGRWAISRSIVEQTAPSRLGAFDRSTSGEQARMALAVLPLKTYGQGMSPEELQETINHNAAVLKGYMDAGLLANARMSESGAMQVQISAGGAWHPIIQEAATLRARVDEVRAGVERLLEVDGLGDEEIVKLQGRYIDVESPIPGQESITMPSQYTRAVVRQAETFASTLAELVPHLGGALDEIDYSSFDIPAYMSGTQGER